jgi:gamma-glutamyltranspeptidase/glutathione hydrolase
MNRSLAARRGGLLAAIVLVAACGHPTRLDYQIPPQTSAATGNQPEGASGHTEKPGWAYARQAVAAANPLATDAGHQVLRAGGSAVDAAIAVQMVLTLVEPQSSGIGGGAFLLHHDGKRVQAFDGRETAPAGVGEDLFLQADGRPMPFPQAVVGGRSVGVPGTVAMLEMAHRQHGKLPWAALMEPAIRLADSGFAVSPRLHTLLRAEQALRRDPRARQYFYQPHEDAAKAEPWPVGHLLRNPALADVLRSIARDGSRALKEGPAAQAMVAAVQGHATNPGRLSLQDLAAYQPVLRDPLCAPLPVGSAGVTPQTGARGTLCGFPPPSSGAIAIGQILGMLQHTPAATLGLEADPMTPSAQWLHLYTEAARLAFADRALYVADPAFVPAPADAWSSLINPVYLRGRAGQIGITPGAPSMKLAQAGQPFVSGSASAPSWTTAFGPMADQPERGTSHISIADAHGNTLAMTTTIEDGWGARLMVSARNDLSGGFLLNNELTDFSFAPRDAQGRPIANRVQPGKRPRSSMSPTLVLDANGQAVMSLGSPGGAAIIHYTAKTLYAMLNWGLLPQQAINLPNFGSMNGPTLLEEKRFPKATVDALNARGHEVREQNMTSGLQALVRGQSHGTPVWFGGADPRREGVVLGD